MKILMVTPNLPQPSWGAATRNYYFLKALAGKHNVSLLSWIDSAEEEADKKLLTELASTVDIITRSSSPANKRIQQLLSVLRGRSYMLSAYSHPEVQEALTSLLTREAYDVVLFEGVVLAGYQLPEGVKVIIDEHNIEYELLQRTAQKEKMGIRKWYNWQESRLLKRVEIERCRRADAVLVTSERESLALKKMLPHSGIEVVPNGVDIERFRREDTEQESAHQIVFTGAMHYYPNVDAVLFFAEKCWPLIRAHVPDVTWNIVGADPLPEVWKLARLPGVTVTGSVADVYPYLSSAALAIAPLRIGSGTRLKILEALSMGKAVVSTSVGCEGLSVEPGTHLLVEDQPEAFANAVVAFLRSQSMRSMFGAAGRKLVEVEYSWQHSGERLLHVVSALR